MMSRVSNGDGLHILCPFSLEELKNVTPPKIIVNEFKRLQEIEQRDQGGDSSIIFLLRSFVIIT
jgi:hypothetical protein